MAYYNKTCVVFFLIMMAFFRGSMGNVYKVGDSAGWTNTGVDYEKWASSHTFKVGDKLVFNYDPAKYDVVEVSQQDYNICNANSPFSKYNSGNDELEIITPGTFYYICSDSNMCQADKLKVAIKIDKEKSTPSPPFPADDPNARPCMRTNSGAAAASPLSLGTHYLGLLASCVFALFLH
ncbi:UNVERIFIED_CONTAM: hypothetical protein Slati_1023800 [Sesamum latifolium]|uniref:Phytocyanin domain-containing protein n=1 Tax=Sesamum latifolium TaxID=2727402 RepID=A0AAW2XSW5_9LAMI